jgi:hypothetical protein
VRYSRVVWSWGSFGESDIDRIIEFSLKAIRGEDCLRRFWSTSISGEGQTDLYAGVETESCILYFSAIIGASMTSDNP